jgi:hypothetical protein
VYRRTAEQQLFVLILGELVKNGDLTNQLLEVSVKKDGKVELRRITLPAEEDAGSGH